jgi:hypothetical protein
MAYDPEEERDGRGRWTTAYHGTQVPEDFRAFSDHRFGRSDEKSLGFHFASTPEGANDRLRNLNPKKYAPGNTDEFGTNARIIPVKIQGHNFIHVDDQTDWRDLFRVLRDEKGFNLRGPKEGAITREYLNRVLTRLGYHGVSYTNRVEAPGQTSFLVLNTKRIKMMKSLRPETIEYLKGIGLTTHAGRGRRKNRPMGRARIFLKDMDVGDVHLPANIGGDAPRRRPRKCPALSLARPEPNMTPAQAYVQKHFFSAKRRRKLAATGAAMPGGSFPIEAPKDVHNAMELLHHHDTPAVRAHIKSRAQALGMGDPFQKDWTQFDQERGAGEKTGRVAGLGTGLYATPRVARIVSRVMISRGFKRFPALGAGAIAAYGTVRGAQAAGGYVGRKIDELGAKVFKAGGTDEARDEAGRWTATQHHLDQANHHAKMARAYISAAPNLSGKKLSDAVDAADMHTTAAAFHAGEAERLHAMAPKMGHLA